MKGMKLIYLFLAFLCAGIGAVGVVLPILPTTPFLLLASFLFAKGSDRFHSWFIQTKLYKKHLESFVKSRGMTLKTKLCILLPVSCMLICSMIFVDHIHARIAMGVLIVVKYWYFFSRIETLTPEQLENNLSSGLE